MNKILLVILAIVSVATGCVSVSSPALERTYQPSEIVRDIEALAGREVRVEGYLRLGQEARALWDSQRDFEEARDRGASGDDAIWGRCITAYYDLSIARDAESAAGSMIDAVGTIGISRDESAGVDLWGCNDVYVTIHRISRRVG